MKKIEYYILKFSPNRHIQKVIGYTDDSISGFAVRKCNKDSWSVDRLESGMAVLSWTTSKRKEAIEALRNIPKNKFDNVFGTDRYKKLVQEFKELVAETEKEFEI